MAQLKKSETPAMDFDVLLVGEALIDLISEEFVSSLSDAQGFRRFIGGEVTNVALNLARLGGRAAIAACVGDDGFGHYIQRQLELANVNTDCLHVTSHAPTTVAINARQTSTPDFIIYRGADALIPADDRLPKIVAASRGVHTSAFALSREPARSVILRSLESAHESGRLVSLDPNYHRCIWPDVADFTAILKEVYCWVDVTKPSWDDCIRLFGPGLAPEDYARRFMEWGPTIVALTMGAEGVLLAIADAGFFHIEPTTVPVADITGAGDAFWAGLLLGLLDGLSPQEAACVGQMVAEIKIGQVGPVTHMPDRADLYELLETTPYECKPLASVTGDASS